MKKLFSTIIAMLPILAMAQPPVYSIKFNSGDTGDEETKRYTIFTCINKQYRVDSYAEGVTWNEDDVLVPYSDHEVILVLGAGNSPMEYREGEWSESYYAAQELSAIRTAKVKDQSSFYVTNDGFKESGTAVICGKTCKKYVGKIQNMGGYDDFKFTGNDAEIYVWNGLTMRLVVSGNVVYEVIGYTENVPASALKQTLDVTWF